MAKRPNNKTVQTAAQFKANMETFIAHIGSVIKKGPDGRARFPDFELTEVIKGKIFEANSRFEDGDIKGAFDLLTNATRHFDSQQAAYAKNTLLNGLKCELRWIEENCDRDLVDKAKAAAQPYIDLVSGDFFDLDDASTAYWLVVDEFRKVEELDETRQAKRQIEKSEAEAAAARERRRVQDEADQRAREVEESRRRATAQNLNDKLTSLLAS